MVIISVVSICLFACLSDDNFRKPWRTKFIFAHRLVLQGIRVKFVYEGHRVTVKVKVKVTGPKKIHNRYELDPHYLEMYRMCKYELPYVKTFESYRLTDRQTYRINRNYIPRRFVGGQQAAHGLWSSAGSIDRCILIRLVAAPFWRHTD